MSAHAAVTSAEVLAFLNAKIADLRLRVPGYISLAVEVSMHPPYGPFDISDRSPRATFKAYCEHSGHSPAFEDVDLAIEWVIACVGGRTEAEIVRAEAEKLLKRAEELEAQGK